MNKKQNIQEKKGKKKQKHNLKSKKECINIYTHGVYNLKKKGTSNF